MKKITIILSVICILFTGCAYCEEESSDNNGLVIPPGMEVIKKGDVNLVVYKGGRMSKQDDVMIPESTTDYTSRKFMEAEERFEKMESELEAQKKELEDLKSAVKNPEEDGRNK